MEVILCMLFVFFVIKITFGCLRLIFRIMAGMTGFFILLFLGAVCFALVSAAVSILKGVMPLVLIAGSVILVIHLIRKSSTGSVC